MFVRIAVLVLVLATVLGGGGAASAQGPQAVTVGPLVVTTGTGFQLTQSLKCPNDLVIERREARFRIAGGAWTPWSSTVPASLATAPAPTTLQWNPVNLQSGDTMTEAIVTTLRDGTGAPATNATVGKPSDLEVELRIICRLPDTGAELGIVAAIGATMLAAGLAIEVIVRRRSGRYPAGWHRGHQ